MSERPPADHPSGPGPRGADEGPTRYASFSDYVRVVRRHRWLVLAITVLAAGISLAISASKPTVYSASAQVSFRDLLADLNLIGVGDAVPELAPAQLAQINADSITRPEVTRKVQRRIKPRLSRSELEESVTGTVGVQTNLVQVGAEAGDAKLAAEIANAYAEAAAAVGIADQRRRLADAEQALLDEVAQARRVDETAPDRGVRISVLEQTLSRVQFLQEVAEPVRIVERAEAPSDPISPQPARDGILGAMVGLVLGLLAAFGRESLDRRMHNARELHDELGVPVLSRVPDSAFGAAGLVANGKPAMAESDFEAFRVLRMNLASIGADGPPRSILVTSSVADEGKTTVSLALACASTVAGQRTLLVECDLRRPALAKRLPIEGQPGLSDYLLERATPQEILQTVELSPPSGGPNGSERIAAPSGSLVCISAGTPVTNPAELLVSPRFEQFVARVSDSYDLVVLDGGPLLSIVDPLQLVPRVDGVLFCVRAQRTTRDQVRAARAALANLPRRPVGAVLTGLKRRGPDSYDYYYGY